MLLTKEDIKRQTRDLWKLCFEDSEEFMDIYFEEKYTDEANITLRPEGRVVAAAQLLPYRMHFYGSVLHAGYVSGLCVHPDYRGRGMAAQILREGHRRLYRQGGTVSFLVPGDDGLRKFYESPRHGAYWTTTYRAEKQLQPAAEPDGRIEIVQPDEWGMELYVFFRRHAALPFMFHPGENDFFAALSACDLAGGRVLVARRRRRVVGVCLSVREPDGRVFVRSMLTGEAAAKDAFIRYLQKVEATEQVHVRMPVAGAMKGAEPYVMARVVNVERFLRAVLAAHPGFQLHIGVDGDLDVPENNGYYLVKDGRVHITDSVPPTIVTPGGLASMLMSAQPTWAEMLLDE